MALGALGFGLARASIDHRVAVLALTRNVGAGQQLSSADLAVVEVSSSPGLSDVPSSQENSMIGRIVAMNLVAGGLLVPAELGSPATVQAGEAVVAVDVHQGSTPSSLQPGSHVIVVDTSTGSAAGGAGFGRATVLSESGPDASGDVSISLVVGAGTASEIASASAAGNVALVVVPS